LKIAAKWFAKKIKRWAEADT